MRHFLCSISLIFCLMIFQLFGCSEDTEIDITGETDSVLMETLELETIAVRPTPEMTFDQLQNEFAGRLNNQGDFTGLRDATTSEIYLNFLSRAYPTKVHVKSLEEYFQVAPPDKKKYTFFLNKWIRKPIEEDIALTHEIIIAYRGVDFTFFKTHHEEEQRVFDSAPLKKRIEIISSLKVEEFIRRYKIPFVEFAIVVDEFVLETEQMDAVWLHEQIKEHGVDFGLLRSALYKPALIGEILQNFSSTDLFLKWVNETRVKEK